MGDVPVDEALGAGTPEPQLEALAVCAKHAAGREDVPELGKAVLPEDVAADPVDRRHGVPLSAVDEAVVEVGVRMLDERAVGQLEEERPVSEPLLQRLVLLELRQLMRAP